jgi:hypothetical protein
MYARARVCVTIAIKSINFNFLRQMKIEQQLFSRAILSSKALTYAAQVII